MGAPGLILRLVRAAALRRAAESLIAERGPGARLADGRAAALLPLLASDASLAFKLLRAACEAHVEASWFAALAEAASRSEDVDAAVRVWCRA